MSRSLLGQEIDIHTGGVEHIPVHHNNEIAQAEAATGKRFVQYWLHNNHITIEGKKISKSFGNTIYLHNIIDRGLNPRSLRYWFLTAHYRSPANFTWDAIEAADTALKRLHRAYLETHSSASSAASRPEEVAATDSNFKKNFSAAIANDLDTPKALALVWDMVKDPNISSEDKRAGLTLADRVLGLGISEKQNIAKLKVMEQKELPDEVGQLVRAREDARASKDFTTADELRNKILELGYEIQDTPKGPEITPKK